jgi:hypothetical protein
MPFADKRAFLENILIHVGHFPRVRINARVAGKKPDEPRSPGAGQTHAHARLQNAVAFGDNPARGVEHRTVQRMGHRADELPGGFARQLGVGVERDDILDGRQDGRLPHDFGKASREPPRRRALNSMSFPRLRS